MPEDSDATSLRQNRKSSKADANNSTIWTQPAASTSSLTLPSQYLLGKKRNEPDGNAKRRPSQHSIEALPSAPVKKKKKRKDDFASSVQEAVAKAGLPAGFGHARNSGQNSLPVTVPLVLPSHSLPPTIDSLSTPQQVPAVKKPKKKVVRTPQTATQTARSNERVGVSERAITTRNTTPSNTANLQRRAVSDAPFQTHPAVGTGPSLLIARPSLEATPQASTSQTRIQTEDNDQDETQAAAEEANPEFSRATLSAAMRRRDVWEGIDIDAEDDAPPAFAGARPLHLENSPEPAYTPAQETQAEIPSAPVPNSPPPIYFSRPSSPAGSEGSHHEPFLRLPTTFDASALHSLPTPMESDDNDPQTQLARAWMIDVRDGISLDERIHRDIERRRAIFEPVIAKTTIANAPETAQETVLEASNYLSLIKTKSSPAKGKQKEMNAKVPKQAADSAVISAPIPSTSSSTAKSNMKESLNPNGIKAKDAPASIPLPSTLATGSPKTNPSKNVGQKPTEKLPAANTKKGKVKDNLPKSVVPPISEEPRDQDPRILNAQAAQSELEATPKAENFRDVSKEASETIWVPVTLKLCKVPDPSEAQLPAIEAETNTGPIEDARPLPVLPEPAKVDTAENAALLQPLIRQEGAPSAKPSSPAEASTKIAPPTVSPPKAVSSFPISKQSSTNYTDTIAPRQSRVPIGRQESSSSDEEPTFHPSRKQDSSSTPAVTVWGAENSENTAKALSTASAVQRWQKHELSIDEDERKKEGRRHSALLVRPMSVKRKPPTPAPRRWARAVERASYIPPVAETGESSSGFESADPFSDSQNAFVQPRVSRIEAQQLGPPFTNTPPPTSQRPLPPVPSTNRIQDLVSRFEQATNAVSIPLAPVASSSKVPYTTQTPQPPPGAFRLPRRLPPLPTSPQKESTGKLTVSERRSARYFPPSPDPNQLNTDSSSDDQGPETAEPDHVRAPHFAYSMPSYVPFSAEHLYNAAPETAAAPSALQDDVVVVPPESPSLKRRSRILSVKSLNVGNSNTLPGRRRKLSLANVEETPDGGSTTYHRQLAEDTLNTPSPSSSPVLQREDPIQSFPEKQPSLTTPIEAPTEEAGAQTQGSSTGRIESSEATNQNTPLQPATSLRRQASVWYTDLDALVDRINRADAHDGTNYDDLLLIQDVLGNARAPAAAKSEERTYDAVAVAPIELESRRTDKFGKVKTKLACCGLRVNKCAICMAQFKEGNLASIFPECLHVFHADCLAKWLHTSKACPTCRRPISP